MGLTEDSDNEDLELDSEALGSLTVDFVNSDPDATDSMDVGAAILDSFFFED